MKTVTVHRAGDLGKSVVEPVTIVIGESVDTAILQPDTLHLWEMLLVSEGNAVADALVDTLPQGVLHRVTVRLLERWVGSFNGTFMGPLALPETPSSGLFLKWEKATGDIWLHIRASGGLQAAINLGVRPGTNVVQRALTDILKTDDPQKCSCGAWRGSPEANRDHACNFRKP